MLIIHFKLCFRLGCTTNCILHYQFIHYTHTRSNIYIIYMYAHYDITHPQILFPTNSQQMTRQDNAIHPPHNCHMDLILIGLYHSTASHFPKEIFLVQLPGVQFHRHIILGIFHLLSNDMYKTTIPGGYIR